MDELFKILLIIHIAAGTLSLITFWIPVFVKKGGDIHLKVGKVYVFLMWVVVITAGVMSMMNLIRGHVIMGALLGFLAILTAHPLWYGMTILKYKKEVPDKVKRISLILNWMLFVGGALLLAWAIILKLENFAILLMVFGLLGMMTSASLVFGKKKKQHWLAVHIEGLLGTGIAAYTAFFAFGGSRLLGHILVDGLMVIPWILPTVLGVFGIKYWKRKMNFSSPKKNGFSVKPNELKLNRRKMTNDIERILKFTRVGFIAALFLLVFQLSVDAQVYVEKQTRHRFAQMTMGLDYFGSAGVQSNFLSADGVEETVSSGNMTTPRLIIGGTHFWGHADFSVVFPLSSKNYDMDGKKLVFGSGVETSFKYFPWRIQHHRFAPYLGIAFSGYFYQQRDANIENGLGPLLEKNTFPLMAGFTFNHKNHLLEAGISYLSNNKSDYYLSEIYKSEVTVAPTFVNLSYRYMLDTSIGAERSWESGQTEKQTEQFASEGKLNGFYVSAGPSAAIGLGKSSYNTSERPFLFDSGGSTFGDFGIGYYLHDPDLNFTLNYRAYKGTNEAYNVKQTLGRQSIGLEVTKMLGDYHGFVPFIGPILSLENVSFSEEYGGDMVHDLEESKVGMGITFGWDIRPNRVQSWLLRTNLRLYPKLDLEVGADQLISFNVLEFNFIQFVYYPGRRKLHRS